MIEKLLVGLAILALSTSAALAAHRAHYRHPMNAYARVVAPPPAAGAPPAAWMGGVSSSDRETYLKNLHDSGYDPRNDYANGLMRTQ